MINEQIGLTVKVRDEEGENDINAEEAVNNVVNYGQCIILLAR